MSWGLCMQSSTVPTNSGIWNPIVTAQIFIIIITIIVNSSVGKSGTVAYTVDVMQVKIWGMEQTHALTLDTHTKKNDTCPPVGGAIIKEN